VLAGEPPQKKSIVELLRYVRISCQSTRTNNNKNSPPEKRVSEGLTHNRAWVELRKHTWLLSRSADRSG
jgi:hypothetical protein